MDNKFSRRSFLKGMFSLAALASVDAMGMTRFIPSEKQKKRMVFYFSATGNSLYVARSFSDEPISIPQVIHHPGTVYEADEIGFVFPDYAASAPQIVRRFVEQNTFKAKYIFSIITYGNFAANVSEWWDDFCKDHGVKNDYINTLLMVDNYLPVFDMNEQIKIDKGIDTNLPKLVAEVAAATAFIAPMADMASMFGGRPGGQGGQRPPQDNPPAGAPQMPDMKTMMKGLQDRHWPMDSARLLTITSDCIGCGTCAQVCPRGNFKVTDVSVTSGDCEYCLACVNACPQKAIVLTAGERNKNARFRNPNVSLKDIIKSNEQK